MCFPICPPKVLELTGLHVIIVAHPTKAVQRNGFKPCLRLESDIFLPSKMESTCHDQGFFCSYFLNKTGFIDKYQKIHLSESFRCTKVQIQWGRVVLRCQATSWENEKKPTLYSIAGSSNWFNKTEPGRVRNRHRKIPDVGKKARIFPHKMGVPPFFRVSFVAVYLDFRLPRLMDLLAACCGPELYSKLGAQIWVLPCRALRTMV